MTYERRRLRQGRAGHEADGYGNLISVLSAHDFAEPRVPARLTGIFVPSVSTASHVSFVFASIASDPVHIDHIRPMQTEEPPRIERRFQARNRLLLQP